MTARSPAPASSPLVALGLAATPILASAAAGIAVVFGRRVSIGDYAIVAGRTGKVKATTMLEVMLEDDDGCAIHVPHLLSLIHPTKVLGRSPPVVVELVVSSDSALARSARAPRRGAPPASARCCASTSSRSMSTARAFAFRS